MNKYRILFLKLCLMIIFGFVKHSTSFAQQNDKDKVEQAIENYIIGWRNGDKELLKKTFDLEAGVVLWVNKKGESEKLNSMKLLDLANRVKVQKDFGIGYTIQSLEIIDAKLALAMVKIPMTNGHYIDCLELQKINDIWKIVLKSFVYFPKKL